MLEGITKTVAKPVHDLGFAAFLAVFEGRETAHSWDRPIQWSSVARSQFRGSDKIPYPFILRPGMGSNIAAPSSFKNAVRSGGESRKIIFSLCRPVKRFPL